MHVYPNPFSNRLTIENHGTCENTSYDIVNAKGEVVFKGNLDDKVTVKKNTFQPGIYLIRFDNGHELTFQKVINK